MKWLRRYKTDRRLLHTVQTRPLGRCRRMFLFQDPLAFGHDELMDVFVVLLRVFFDLVIIFAELVRQAAEDRILFCSIP